MTHKLGLAVLLHMHQPYYIDPGTGVSILPWVRLHGVKDYLGLPLILNEFPSVKLTFNLVPCLVQQVLNFANGRTTDFQLSLSAANPTNLSRDEAVAILATFFHCNHERMIHPQPRYLELLELRGQNVTPPALEAVARSFGPQDWLDLQVWFNLAWIHGEIIRTDPFLSSLRSKQRRFTLQERDELLERHKSLLAGVVPSFSALAQTGQIELSTSPFYHPILPLLADTDLARQANPAAHLPQARFCYPEDVAQQINRGVEFHQQTFGEKPRGMWPSEGSVAEQILPAVMNAGLNWIASDEEILAKSLRVPFYRNRRDEIQAPELLYVPYVLERDAGKCHIVFRDHVISDLIGFVYSRWPAKRAAEDFVGRLRSVWERTRDEREPRTVYVVLDGENAWEYYENGGIDFLRELFSGLEKSSSWLETVTVSESIARHPRPGVLPRLEPGSWIQGNFEIWIGDTEENTGWTALAEARASISPLDAEAYGYLMIAEGSDWFWWYGDDHFTENKLEFDRLFRFNLMAAYRAAGLPVPGYLDMPITSAPRPTFGILQPRALINPLIDGKITSYWEWLGAGVVEEPKRYGAIHPSRPALVKSVMFGYNLTALHVRIDPTEAILMLGKEIPVEISLQFIAPKALEVTLGCRIGEGGLVSDGVVGGGEMSAAMQQVIEVSVPFGALSAESGQQVVFHLQLRFEDGWLERYPENQEIRLSVPAADFASRNWFV